MYCPACDSEYVAGIQHRPVCDVALVADQYAVDATHTVGPLARRRILVRESDLDRAREILQAVPLPDLPLEG